MYTVSNNFSFTGLGSDETDDGRFAQEPPGRSPRKHLIQMRAISFATFEKFISDVRRNVIKNFYIDVYYTITSK